MTAAIKYTAPKGASAQHCLAEFVSFCRDSLTAFGKELPFDAPSWNVTGHIVYKGSASTEVRLNFSNLETASTYNKDFTPMVEPFASFAKAMIRYEHSLRPKVGYAPYLSALRALEAQLLIRHGRACPTLVDLTDLNEACNRLREKQAASTAYNSGTSLELLINTAREHGIVVGAPSWKCTLKSPQRLGSKVGKDALEKRKKKLPSPRAFEALGYIFQNPKDLSDVVTTTVAAMLCSAPSRISEPLILPAACKVYDRKAGEAEKLGLRWWPAKGAAPMTKWIPAPMIPVIHEAIDRILVASKEGRAVAKWYEDNPTALYLPPHLTHLRNHEYLTMRELASIVWDDNSVAYTSNRPSVFCKSHKLKVIKVDGKSFAKFSDLEKVIVEKLPRSFPILDIETGLKYSEALFCFRTYELTERNATLRCMIEPVSVSEMTSRLSGTGGMTKASIFARHNFTEDDGSPIRLTTHVFRHYLNTLSQTRGMSGLDIAKWSGRANIAQNAAYDHMTDLEVMDELRNDPEFSKEVSLTERLSQSELIAREQFAALGVRAAHTTDLGYCVHDFQMTPCQLHEDCPNCSEQWCIKGELDKERNLRRSIEETETLLMEAEAEMAEGTFGADRWVLHQQKTLARLKSLQAIVDDPQVPIGSVIRPTIGNSAWAINRAIKIRPVAATFLADETDASDVEDDWEEQEAKR